MSPEKVISQIEFEIEQVDKLLDLYESLLNQSKNGEPDLVEITALASVLHSFYNGIENTFLTIAKRIDKVVPEGKQWHRDILIQMAKKTEKRSPVISTELKIKLAEYLAFRHFYRHSYSFNLRWDEIEKLVCPLLKIWDEVKKELNQFLNKVEK